MAKSAKVKVITPLFIANWVFLFTPKAARKAGGKPKYSVTCLFKTGEDLTAVKAAILEVGKSAWGPEPKKWPKISHLPLKDQGTQLRKNDAGDE